MVSKLRYFRSYRSFARWVKGFGYSERVARKAWKGKGWYYHRGKGYFVKYSQARDRKRGGKVGRGPWRHTHDLTKIVVKLSKYVKSVAKEVARRKERSLAKKGVKRGEAKRGAAKHTVITAVKRARRTTRLSPEVKKIAYYLWESIPRKYREGKRKVWTYIAVVALAKAIRKYTKERGLDWKAVDWAHEIDWAQGYNYAKQHVKELLGVGKYEDISEREIREIERHWEVLSKELRLPDTIDPWELKALFE